jgi:16S rRNA (guanine527-N7)-methyltransferase
MTGSALSFGDVPRETEQKLRAFGDLLLAENARQNLISKASVAQYWERHVMDSAQLLRFAPRDADWLDIGSGPGLPGLVLAILGVRAITLVEPRRLRTEFLERSVAELRLGNVRVVTGKVEQVGDRYDVVTARAVAPLARLLDMAERLTGPESHWVLPKGRSAAKELEEARRTWQGEFRLEPSLTDPESRIVVATRVRRRTGRG